MSLFIYPILIIAGLLRFYNNTALALWHDEAFSALYMRYSWDEMMYRIGLDVHPPLYYWILRLWTGFAGEHLMSLRLLSIIFGVLTVWAAYAFVKVAWGRRLALLAALAIALNPFQIQYALEARMYTLGTFLALWSSYFMAKALQSEGVRKKYWIGYSLTVAAMLYTHYYLVFTIAAQGLFILMHIIKYRSYKNILAAAAVYAGAAILYVPWLPTFMQQVARVQESYWIPPMNAWSIPGTLWKMIFGGTGVRNSVLVIATLVTLLIFFYVIKKSSNFYKWFVVASVLMPVAAAVLLSLKTDIYLDRYFVFASSFFSLLVMLALWHIGKRAIQIPLVVIFLGAMTYAFFGNWQVMDIKGKPGMAAASEVVNIEAGSNDKIIVGSSFIYFTFKYYNETGIDPQLISDRRLRDIPHFSGTAILTDDDLILDLDKFKKGQTVWLLWTTGFGGSKPGLPKNWREQSERSYADAPGFKGHIYVTRYTVN
ncbi:MAG: hypothetical protein A3C85_01265 [Candidatus Doudnabacteria bacterium RIFCSPHIGHO2_02_FULL_48_21]|uniref:Glycosyltransferase RgtA/B/C/D-like domain-containing protein n=1 Tax=Candidatus Doudnabacteria bacterium RIFCSPLOWO2_02_FULL_48_13 TaxID=1817845 RepID=A0A1F5Q957_9BACT|nr:MAG: hypothetical protein A3K05_04310 [Candidatus Doudnabacteria bacterium RIFCSPHIGHO2_01_48_18]OGE79586.1 MAG: hypothetical protein A2668_03320 [Candidatus Doudnabacteria bacterium RIFCSPHIGHO2_01_FULL_48_180]OGE91113.1 MAG: hypothetical protein A3F44_02205 [Candidatus Doudnabacteria bacterium RIFCSPHIGHO2_12_FULL_47_25]OGE93803.1 MAG: hypothetical protein A3C85_01265 [Candidatus Doudnabacteria bacterium RIFCSPHIGHO2_02_FULL_48_21]OGE97989.1 MAG: hypothetical protein A3A83_00850 [Candidatu